MQESATGNLNSCRYEVKYDIWILLRMLLLTLPANASVSANALKFSGYFRFFLACSVQTLVVLFLVLELNDN